MKIGTLLITTCIAAFISCDVNEQQDDLIYKESYFSIKIDQKIKDVFETLNLSSGITIGVLHRDTILLAKGYGYSHLNEQIKMTATTPFYNASSTKAFTSVLAAILEDKNFIDLNTSVKEYIPNLDMAIAYKEVDITLLDLLTHTHGVENIPSQLASAYTGYENSDQLIDIINKESYARESKDFRYSNLGPIIAAIAMEKVMNKSWKVLLKEYIFEPLEMQNTSCFISDYELKELVHSIDKNKKLNSYFDKTDKTMHPAGGMITTVEDMLKFLSVFTNNGYYKGKAFLSEELLDKITKTQVKQDRNFRSLERYAYGIGWDIALLDDVKHISRNGGFQLLASQVSFIPDYNLAIVSLSNGPERISYMIEEMIYNIYLDKFDEVKFQNFISSLQELTKRNDSIAMSIISNELNTNYKHNANVISGTYTDEIWGTFKIYEKGSRLYGEWGDINGEINANESESYTFDNRVFTRLFEYNQDKNTITMPIFGDTIIYEKVK